MARRAGKSASRKARQRNVPRPSRTAATRPAASIPAVEAEAVPPVGTPDAREAASLTPPRRVTPPPAASGRSRLSGAERAEYHYVERDLRSMGILTAVMLGLLILAWFAFNALGLVA